MLFLTGQYDLTIDDKSRLSVPSRVRERIDVEEYGGAFYLTVGVNEVLYLYPDKYYYEHIALAVAPGTVAPDESLAFDRVNGARAGRVELDRQGRVLLGEKARRSGRLGDQVTLVGARNHLELWNPEEWQAYLRERSADHEKMLLRVHDEVLRSERAKDGWR